MKGAGVRVPVESHDRVVVERRGVDGVPVRADGDRERTVQPVRGLGARVDRQVVVAGASPRLDRSRCASRELRDRVIGDGRDVQRAAVGAGGGRDDSAEAIRSERARIPGGRVVVVYAELRHDLAGRREREAAQRQRARDGDRSREHAASRRHLEPSRLMHQLTPRIVRRSGRGPTAMQAP
jgi:hypothetical protein